jgi:hypothetical protein
MVLFDWPTGAGWLKGRVVVTIDATIDATVDFHGLGLRLGFFLLEQCHQGTRGGFVQGSKVACVI